MDKAESIGKPDLLIIPWHKNTIGDLTFLNERGIVDEYRKVGKTGNNGYRYLWWVSDDGQTD